MKFQLILLVCLCTTNICYGQKLANVKNFGARGNGITDDTKAIARAISSGAANVYFPAGKYLVTNTISLRSNLKLSGEGIKSIIISRNTTELFKAFNSQSYINIAIKGLRFTANKVMGDQQLSVLLQVYNTTNFLAENCFFDHASAAIGLQNTKNITLRNNTVSAMFEQPLNSKDYPGNYGYGFVLNECENAVVSGNTLGTVATLGYIERHALYISNTKAVGAKNSKNIQVVSNKIQMKPYTQDGEALTGFEFAFKCISGEQILIKGNTVSGGIGGLILSLTTLNAKKIVLQDNVFLNLLKSGVKITCEEAQCPALVEDLTVLNNKFNITGTYGVGIIAKNFKELKISGNTFVNGVKDISMPSTAYYIYSAAEGATYKTGRIDAADNQFNGFTQLGSLGLLGVFNCNDLFSTDGINITAAALLKKAPGIVTTVQLNRQLLN